MMGHTDSSTDENLRAFRALLPELLQKWPGEYVAFNRGNLVEHSRRRQDLLEAVRRRFPDESVFVAQVAEATRGVRGQRPARIRKTG
jgi:hypothetical protein